MMVDALYRGVNFISGYGSFEIFVQYKICFRLVCIKNFDFGFPLISNSQASISGRAEVVVGALRTTFYFWGPCGK